MARVNAAADPHVLLRDAKSAANRAALAVAFTPSVDGTTLLAVGLDRVRGAAGALVWDVAVGRAVAALGNSEAAAALAWVPGAVPPCQSQVSACSDAFLFFFRFFSLSRAHRRVSIDAGGGHGVQARADV